MMADVRSAVDERGADVNEAADDGRTPLMCACSYCVDPDVVGFLLSKGADARAAEFAAALDAARAAEAARPGPWHGRRAASP